MTEIRRAALVTLTAAVMATIGSAAVASADDTSVDAVIDDYMRNVNGISEQLFLDRFNNGIQGADAAPGVREDLTSANQQLLEDLQAAIGR